MSFMNYFTYRRPVYTPPTPRILSSDSDSEGYASARSNNVSSYSHGIPDALSFETIVNNGSCPPCTARDFMNYLVYIERSAENLQFFLWHRDYIQRFMGASNSETDLSPPWTDAQQEAALQAVQAQAAARHAARALKSKGAHLEMFKEVEFTKMAPPPASLNPFSTPPGTAEPGLQKDLNSPWDYHLHLTVSQTASVPSSNPTVSGINAAITAEEAFSEAGLQKPFSIQPFREEVDRIIATYLVEDAPRELNLSCRERTAVLHALEYTTHPSAFHYISKTIESSLRHQAHPNFIRWTICNGNRPRVAFARGLGVGTILIGLMMATLFTLSSLARGWRAMAAIPLAIGISTLFAAWKGMCVVLHGMHHRHLRPWELFAEQEAESEKKNSFDSFGSRNSYEDEPWVVKYDHRNMIRKVFDREVWVQEPVLRQIQDAIFIQSVTAALIISAIITAVFVALPGGNFF